MLLYKTENFDMKLTLFYCLVFKSLGLSPMPFLLSQHKEYNFSNKSVFCFSGRLVKSDTCNFKTFDRTIFKFDNKERIKEIAFAFDVDEYKISGDPDLVIPFLGFEYYKDSVVIYNLTKRKEAPLRVISAKIIETEMKMISRVNYSIQTKIIASYYNREWYPNKVFDIEISDSTLKLTPPVNSKNWSEEFLTYVLLMQTDSNLLFKNVESDNSRDYQGKKVNRHNYLNFSCVKNMPYLIHTFSFIQVESEPYFSGFAQGEYMTIEYFNSLLLQKSVEGEKRLETIKIPIAMEYINSFNGEVNSSERLNEIIFYEK